MAIREGRWDCTACGRTANLGRDLRCAGCGRARGKVKFYLPMNEPAVRQAELLAAAKAGPDWVCGFCQASNRSTSQACTGCGAPRADGESRVTGGADATELTAAQIEEQEKRKRRIQEMAALQKRQQARTMKIVGAIAGVFLLLCTGLGTFGAFHGRVGGTKGVGGPAIRLGAPSGGADVELVSKEATRRIDVEAERLVLDESWCSSMPPDARVLSRTSRQHGTRRVCEWRRGSPFLAVAGFRVQEDLGNGFFSDSDSGSSGGSYGSSDWGSSGSTDNCRSEPVYEDYCTWEALRWTVIRSPQSLDTVAVPPWPDVSLAPGERKGASVEIYRSVFRARDGETITLNVSQSRWLALQPGARYEASWSFFGGLRSVGAPAGR